MDYDKNMNQPQYQANATENEGVLESAGNAVQGVGEAAVNYVNEVVHTVADVGKSLITNLAKDAEENEGASLSGATNVVTDAIKGTADIGKSTFRFAKDSGEAISDSAKSAGESIKADVEGEESDYDYYSGMGF